MGGEIECIIIFCSDFIIGSGCFFVELMCLICKYWEVWY